MNAQNFDFNTDKTGCGVRHGFCIMVPSGHGGQKVWADQIFATLEAANLTAARCVPTVCDIIPAKEVIHFGKNPKSHAYQRSILINPEPAGTRVGWFAIRVTPGFQKMARLIADVDERRKGESIVERNLRNEGIDVYMPAFWKEIRRHRSRKLFARRFPLLVGYAFIYHDEGKGFDKVRGVDGVSSILRMGSNGAPHIFRDEDLSEIAALAFLREQEFKRTRHEGIEDARARRRQSLNTELGRIIPKGRSRTNSLRQHAEAYLDTMVGGAKSRVLAIIQQLDDLQDDAALDAYREAV
ncbi:transcription termination/antitermination NusG family protein [Rhizobium rhizoryzae]|uniref:transcription termination/antitermination NusG family protein n=1 Tax=Rhizobium rhizoryzae TaxID=451876 RepID=UPI002896B39E|nr:transcription termination/antitermination NusG family protein [Rhizobium rhizoryzae]